MANIKRLLINGLVIKMFSGFLPLILIGLLWTIAIALMALVFGLLLGIVFTVGERSERKIIALSVIGLTSVLRGLPEIVVLFFCYFGGTILLTQLFGHFVGVNTFIAGVFSLGLIFAAYAAQVLGGALRQIAAGQFAAAAALGLSKRQTFLKVILPQLVHHASPGLSNLWLSLLKDTSLVSLIGLGEMMTNIGLAASQTHQPFLFYALAALIYLVLTSVSKRLFERKTLWI